MRGYSSKVQERRHPAWRVFVGVCAFNFLAYGLIINGYGAFLLPTSQGTGLSVTAISLTHSVRTICGTFGSLLAGRVIDRFPLKAYLAVVCVVIAGASFFTALSSQLWQLLLSAGLLGWACGMGVYTLVPLVVPQWFTRPEGLMGIATACGGIGGIVFAPVLTGLMESLGWQSGYFTIVGVALLLMLPIAAGLLRYSPSELGLSPCNNEKKSFGGKASGRRGESAVNPALDSEMAGASLTMGEAVRTPSFYLIAVVFMAVAFISGMYTHFPSMLREEGLSAAATGAMYSFYQVGVASGQLLIGMLSLKLNIKRTMYLFMAMVAAGLLGVVFLSSGPFLLLAFFAILTGSGRAVGVVAGPILVRSAYGQAHYNRIFSTLYTAYLATVAVSTTLYGLIYDQAHSYRNAYVLILLCCAVGAVFTGMSRLDKGAAAPRQRKKRAS